MNPQNGEILAMVSNPSYDDNLFAQGISTDDYQALINDPNRPLVNYGISEQFPPGSTYKLVTGSGALMDGVITPDTQLAHRPVPLDRPVQVLGLEPTRLRPAQRHPGLRRLERHVLLPAGRATWAPTGSLIGHNSSASARKPASTCPARHAASFPTNDWKQGIFGQDVFPGEVYQAGIGQGYDAATPLQVLNAYAALANGGWLYQAADRAPRARARRKRRAGLPAASLMHTGRRVA